MEWSKASFVRPLLFLFFSLLYFALAECLPKQLRKKLWHMNPIVSRISDTVLCATTMNTWGMHDPSVDGGYWEKTTKNHIETQPSAELFS